LTADSIQFQFL